jgi:hypothetical protein
MRIAMQILTTKKETLIFGDPVQSDPSAYRGEYDEL